MKKTNELFVRDSAGNYWVMGARVSEELILTTASEIVETRFRRVGKVECPDASKALFRARIGARRHEVFAVIFADIRNRIIALEELFFGTIDGASVHPRVIVERALALNAAAVVFAHNHPSGNPWPSEPDKALTKRLRQAMALVDIRVLDHIVVTGNNAYSFAEHGEL